MRQPKQVSAGQLFRLVVATVLFSWRMDEWVASRDSFNGLAALFWAVVVFVLAYGIWAMGRIEIEEG